MKKVYIVLSNDCGCTDINCDGTMIEGVFSTREAAEKFSGGGQFIEEHEVRDS